MRRSAASSRRHSRDTAERASGLPSAAEDRPQWCATLKRRHHYFHGFKPHSVAENDLRNYRLVELFNKVANVRIWQSWAVDAAASEFNELPVH